MIASPFYEVTLWEKAAENAPSRCARATASWSGQAHTQAWTDSDVDKRAKQVITDGEIGASLRFATVEIVRGPR